MHIHIQMYIYKYVYGHHLPFEAQKMLPFLVFSTLGHSLPFVSCTYLCLWHCVSACTHLQFDKDTPYYIGV